ncbi:hypothetical protein [Natrinema sp. SYSU A 869]|uniref:DUF7511 domain-containing protein n=1 Tax=Natrinema sp. SYSU A 869 TaxID=2871694 RepID=UPI001CA3FC86|nr:hypothetical protein [Natrinema sp. SYSU A 869]
MSEPSTETSPEFGSPTDRPSRLQHVTVEQADVAVCTMFPEEISEEIVSAQWITATTDSFVSLEQRR